jgi:Type I phosphodiesterase / nucleotide pyrophosphatase
VTAVRTFADIPAEVERLLTGGEHDRVGVILLDAFGRRFLERHAGHPFLRRLEVTELSTQFPSTTAAHITTMHTGRPVGEHGIYEWDIYEPALDAIITPLLFSFAGDQERDTLRDVLDAATLVPGDRLYERLPLPSTVLHPASFSPSTYDRVAARGARLAPFGTLRDGVERFWSALAEPGYAYLYWDRIDGTGHLHGPDSREFDAAALDALDTLERGLRGTGALVMVTADHGQVATNPFRVDWLDELWPDLTGLLTHRPAGSPRDVFLHTDEPDAVIAGLAARLGDDAEVRRAADLVTAGPRSAEVCVLPGPGRMAWLRPYAGRSTQFRGHHGGQHPDETETWVGTLYS